VLLAVSFNQVRQLSASGTVNGATYGLLGTAFALILGVTGRFHYAFGILFTLTAYGAFTLTDRVGLTFWPSAIISVGVITALSVAIEAGVYRPLAARAGASALLSVFVASLGLGIFGQNLIGIIWGLRTNSLAGPDVHRFNALGARVVNIDVWLVVAGVIISGGLAVALRLTPLGRSVKATRSNPELAEIIGINSGAIYLIVFAIGTSIAGLVALYTSLKFSVDPNMGFRPVVLAFVIAFLGGTASSPLRVFITGILVGLVESLSSIWLSVRWTQITVFVVLLGYLITKSANTSTWLRARVRKPAAAPMPLVAK